MRRASFVAALAAAAVAACTSAPPRQAPPVHVVPVAVAPPSRPANAFVPLASSPRSIAAPVVKVGLFTDESTISFPRTEDGYLIIADQGPSMLRRGFTDSAPASAADVHYGVQVAALNDRESAGNLADRIRKAAGVRVDAIFDAGAGLFKVLAGDFASEADARPLRQKLADQSLGKDMMIVKRPSDQPFRKVHRIVDDEGDVHEIESESLLILPASSETIDIRNLPYRGGARLFINGRGLLNVIDELNIEDYVRGVVPNEMGPKVYDEIEGLKAQALAARTYMVKRMGDFRSEGYDICATPACQVYKGFSTEDPLSDQAVKATAGEIITYGGKPIDALFMSTCGGETSDVSTMFPERNEPYLARTRCVEMEMATIDGIADGALIDETAANARLFSLLAGLGPETSWSAAGVLKAVHAAMGLAGVQPRAAAPPQSSRRRDVLGYLGSVLDLSGSASALTLPEDRAFYFPGGSAEDPVHLAAAFLIRYRIVPMQSIDGIDLSAAMPRDELYALLYSWLLQLQIVQETSGKLLRQEPGAVVLKAAGKTTTVPLASSIVTFRRLGDRWKEYGNLPVMIGDRLTVARARNGKAFAITAQVSPDGAGFDRTSNFAEWVRSYRADELVASISKRFAIDQLLGLEIDSTDASHRVKQMTVTAEGGRKVPMEGILIRWSLNLPDNLFTFTKSKDSDGVDRYTFFGKGWGHGVGMCQVGAYGMAFRGWPAEKIIKHYYTGVEISKMEMAN